MNNLFPPILQTFLPAFVENSCEIPFDISPYNSSASISAVQVSVVRQDNNKNALYNNKNPLQSNLFFKLKKLPNERYGIVLSNENHFGEKMQKNTFYKIQMRFSNDSQDIDFGDLDYVFKDDGYVSSHLKNFSEWSSILLIYQIEEPKVVIKSLPPNQEGSELPLLTLPVLQISGTIDENNISPEVLKQYEIKIYRIKNGEEVPYEQSGTIYADSYVAPKSINYTLHRMLEDENTYKIEINYITKNMYYGTEIRKFYTRFKDLPKLHTDISTIEDPSSSGILVKLDAINPNELFSGKVAIRRTSSETNFTYWEDINYHTFNGEPLNYTWLDFTVESNIWYKYGIQAITKEGDRGVFTSTETSAMIDLENLYLGGENKQLEIAYNAQINNLSTQVKQGKIETLGGRYPFFIHNGIVEYKILGISGMISSWREDDKTTVKTDSIQYHDFTEQKDFSFDFMTEEEMYNNSKSLKERYESYNLENYISFTDDYFRERKFFNKAYDFLIDGKPKLLRHAKEGNLIVILTDVAIERDVHSAFSSFTATATEIADCTPENLLKYGIIDIEPSQKDSEWTSEDIVQTLAITGNISQLLAEKDQQNVYQLIINNHIDDFENPGEMSIKELNDIRIEFLDKPDIVNGVLGYEIKIDGNPFVVDKEGIFAVPDFSDIKSIELPIGHTVNIDYNIILQNVIVEKDKNVAIVYENKVSQLWGNYKYNAHLYQEIYEHYLQERDNDTNPINFYTQLISVDGIKIEADEGTVFYLKNFTNEWKTVIVNSTQLLELTGDDLIIQDLVYGGKKMRLKTSADNFEIKDFEYIVSEDTNKNHCVYETEDGFFINYNGIAYPFDNQNKIMMKDGDLIIDYVCEVEKGVLI